MTRKLLLIAFFAIASSSFAMNEKTEIELREESLPPTSLCERSEAKDRDGNVVASGECCRSFTTPPAPKEEFGIRVALRICSDAALEMNLQMMKE